ncbi:MAG TPA: glycosyltransferase family 2 protein [Caldilineaceae bacterium]|nr:glycosyltransferase family 2 protein [Caldilineaceae bacterium]
MRLAVVILNYNTLALLRNCLRSVVAASERHADQLAVEVLVVDSASSDGSAAMVAAEFPAAQLIASPMNLGYTGGNNLGLRWLGFAVAAPTLPGLELPRRSPPDFVLLLNADTEVVGDALWTMANILIQHPEAGACGARLTYGDGAFQHGAFRFPSLTQLAADLFPLDTVPGVRRIWPRFYNGPLNGRYPPTAWQGSRPFAVDFVLGAALMIRAPAIEAVGGLDNDYFMYCEEMDWCLRLARAGWRVLAAPAAEIIHHEGQSSRQVRWSAYERLWRSRIRFYQKHAWRYPRGYLWLVRTMLRAAMRWRACLAERRFARGLVSGTDVAAELKSYAQIARL